eukprot:TRINITY_DN11581_c0_g1_i10.p3 TRINITY_DN11581_c0_g1~~TRINITY_DN11581_c0_g1_i10.p3  ORF type:complete len:121 (-),score=9.77 TRINITY_DN11581_c0_g1_i10:120-482(-)
MREYVQCESIDPSRSMRSFVCFQPSQQFLSNVVTHAAPEAQSQLAYAFERSLSMLRDTSEFFSRCSSSLDSRAIVEHATEGSQFCCPASRYARRQNLFYKLVEPEQILDISLLRCRDCCS